MAGINSGEVKGRAARLFGNKVCSLFRKTSLDFTAVHEKRIQQMYLVCQYCVLKTGA